MYLGVIITFIFLRISSPVFACELSAPEPTLISVIRGIFLAEVELNGNIFDELQERLYQPRFVSFRDEDWQSWLEYNEEMAKKAARARLLANKWPQELVVTGYVQSFGPGQITPRTILNVCRRNPTLDYCRQSTGKQVVRLFDEGGAIAAATAILYDAGTESRKKWGAVPTVGALATAYNVGTDYYLEKFSENEVNAFGKYVENVVCSTAY